MTRARKGAASRQAKVRWFREARGKRGARSRCWRKVRESVIRADVYKTIHRHHVKRNFRSLWITRLTAAVATRGINYSRLIHGLKLAAISVNRKMLSNLAIQDPSAFDQIVELAKKALTAAGKAPKAAAAA